MGELEPVTDQTPHEIGLVIEVIAKTQSIADTVCSFAPLDVTSFWLSREVVDGWQSGVSLLPVRYFPWCGL